jgi:glycosyltransferase involved in cell wall biosynthesis
MRVLLISNMYPDERTLSESRMQPGIFIKYQADFLEKNGIDVIKAVKRTRSPLGYFKFLVLSAYKVLFSDYDIIHAHFVPHSALVPAILNSVRKKPLIVTFHGTDARIYPFKSRFHRMLTLYVVSRSDRVVAVSEEMKTVLVRLGLRDEKIVVIGTGVDTCAFHPIDKDDARRVLGLPADKKIVLYVGRLQRMKGVEDVYESARRMPDTQFIIVGGGDAKTNLDNCLFAGEVSHDRMHLWMSASDLLVLPSRSEGLPCVVMEALSCGIPAVVTAVGGNPELVADGDSGFLVTVGDVDALVGRIREILEDEDLRGRMGRFGREEMIRKYERDTVMERLKEEYISLSRGLVDTVKN